MLVAVSTVIDAPADLVWSRLADFTSWHSWLPRIVSTTMDAGAEQGPVGGLRTLELADGSRVREQLVSRDDSLRRLSYRFDEPTPFRVRGYVGRVRVEEITTTGGAFVHWSGEFDSEASDRTGCGPHSPLFTVDFLSL